MSYMRGMSHWSPVPRLVTQCGHTSRAEVDQVVLPSPHQEKRTITLFFNGTGQYMLNILAGGAAMDSADFGEGIISNLDVSC
jgi:hypothetical protein